jgi:uncharacterized protein (UPF0332 family)
MNPPEKADHMQYRLQKSEETFEAAQLLIENQQWNSAFNRLYYAVFYAGSAL